MPDRCVVQVICYSEFFGTTSSTRLSWLVFRIGEHKATAEVAQNVVGDGTHKLGVLVATRGQVFVWMKKEEQRRSCSAKTVVATLVATMTTTQKTNSNIQIWNLFVDRHRDCEFAVTWCLGELFANSWVSP